MEQHSTIDHLTVAYKNLYQQYCNRSNNGKTFFTDLYHNLFKYESNAVPATVMQSLKTEMDLGALAQVAGAATHTAPAATPPLKSSLKESKSV